VVGYNRKVTIVVTSRTKSQKFDDLSLTHRPSSSFGVTDSATPKVHLASAGHTRPQRPVFGVTDFGCQHLPDLDNRFPNTYSSRHFVIFVVLLFV
jgi:hypothetical protein